MQQVVKATGKYNFEEGRIQLPSRINFEYLETLALNYWDYQLPLFLKYGFPLDFPHEHTKDLISTKQNHASGIKFPTDVEFYLETEKKT